MIEAKRARNILVVSSEIASRALPWRREIPTLPPCSATAPQRRLSSAPPTATRAASSLRHMESWSSGYHDCEIPAGGTRFDFHHDRRDFAAGAFFRMDGKAAYRLAARVVGPFLEALLGKGPVGGLEMSISSCRIRQKPRRARSSGEPAQHSTWQDRRSHRSATATRSPPPFPLRCITPLPVVAHPQVATFSSSVPPRAFPSAGSASKSRENRHHRRHRLLGPHAGRDGCRPRP